jgi:hypothetical protein
LTEPFTESALTLLGADPTLVGKHKVTDVSGAPYFPPVDGLWVLEEEWRMRDKGSKVTRRGTRPSVLMLRFALASLQFRSAKLLSEERREFPATSPEAPARQREARRHGFAAPLSSRLMKSFLAQP